MPLPVMQFSDPMLSRPRQVLPTMAGGLSQGLGQGMNLVQQLQALQQQKAMAPMQQQMAAGKVAALPLHQQLLQAQTQLAQAKAKDPFLGRTLTGPAGSAQSQLDYTRMHGGDPHSMDVLHQTLEAQQRTSQAKAWQGVPSDEKAQAIATAKAAGYDSVRAAQLFASGHSLHELLNNRDKYLGDKVKGLSSVKGATATTLGLDAKNIKSQSAPIRWQNMNQLYAPSAGVRDQQMKAATANASIKYLGGFIHDSIQYGGMGARVTRPWLVDAVSGDPAKQEKAVNYYAAQSLKPELAMYRIRMQGGQASARAMQALMPKIMGSVDVNISNLPKDLQQRVIKKVNDVLGETTNAGIRHTVGLNPLALQKQTAPRAPATNRFAKYTDQDWVDTAKKYNMTVPEAKRRAGAI